MNAKSIFSPIVRTGNGRASFGLILLAALVLMAIGVYSRASTLKTETIKLVAGSPLAANPELILARRYASGLQAATGVLLSPLTRVQAAEAARYQALAGQHYNLYGSTTWTRAPRLTHAQRADAARYTAYAAQEYNLYGSTAWTRAPKPDLARAQAADAARYSALAAEKYNLYGSSAWVRAAAPLNRAQLAEAARYTALAAQRLNQYGSTAWTRAPKNELNRSQLAEAARWTALAIHFGRPTGSISNALAALLNLLSEPQGH